MAIVSLSHSPSSHSTIVTVPIGLSSGLAPFGLGAPRNIPPERFLAGQRGVHSVIMQARMSFRVASASSSPSWPGTCPSSWVAD